VQELQEHLTQGHLEIQEQLTQGHLEMLVLQVKHQQHLE
jgi:hypothetical protein